MHKHNVTIVLACLRVKTVCSGVKKRVKKGKGKKWRARPSDRTGCLFSLFVVGVDGQRIERKKRKIKRKKREEERKKEEIFTRAHIHTQAYTRAHTRAQNRAHVHTYTTHTQTSTPIAPEHN